MGVRLKINDISDEEFSVLLNNVYETLKYFTGHTYIGQHKKKDIQKAYQTFLKRCMISFLFAENLVILCLSLLRAKYYIGVCYIDI